MRLPPSLPLQPWLKCSSLPSRPPSSAAIAKRLPDTEMDTGIQVQFWNVLKYVLLTLILAPVAECAMARVTAWRHAKLVYNGHPIRLKSSWLGNFSLHQEVETLHPSSRLWQVLSIFLALAIALPFEYGSGARSQLIWSQQRSFSSSLATNSSNDLIFLAHNDPRQVECVNPKRLSEVGEFIFMEPTQDKPPFLNGVLTLERVNNLLGDTVHKWAVLLVHSRNGDKDLQLYAGGKGGQLALLVNPAEKGLLIADFESGALCKGFLDQEFSCYDMAGQFTLSQLTYSIASIRGGTIFLRTSFENAAKLYRFRDKWIFNSIGDPKVQANRLKQRPNETGFQWLSRHRKENPFLSISTIELDSQVQSVDCQTSGSVQIRPLILRTGKSLGDDEFGLNISGRGDIILVKGGGKLQTFLLTKAGDFLCAVDESNAICKSSENQTIYFLAKGEGVLEYTSVFGLQITRDLESPTDLAVLRSLMNSDATYHRNGRAAFWDVQRLVESFAPLDGGARTITRTMDAKVAVSTGARVSGTVETWAVLLYGSTLFLLLLLLCFVRLVPLTGITVEDTYRRVVWQRERGSEPLQTLKTAPKIGFQVGETENSEHLIASYYLI